MTGKHVPSVEKCPEAGEGVAVCLWDVVVDGTNVYGEDDGGAQGLHVCDCEIVDVAYLEYLKLVKAFKTYFKLGEEL